MYDTVAMTLRGRPNVDFKLKRLDEWNEERQAGQTVRYSKNISLNVKDGKYNGKLFIGFNNVINSLKVSVALPKLVYGSSLFEVREVDKDIVTEKIKNITDEWIDFDLDNMKMFRLDNSCNLEMNEKAKKYIYALNNNTDEKIGHKQKGHFEGETLRFISNSETDMFYDKLKQECNLKKGEYDFQAYQFRGKNILRYEIQNKTDEAIETTKRYGRKLFYKDLFTDEVIERSKQLRLETLEEILRQLKQRYVLDYSSITRDLENMKEANNRSALNDFAWYVIRKADLLSVDDIQRVMNGAGYSRQAMHKHIKRVKRLEKLKAKENYLINEVVEKIRAKAV